jgi:hypothetical protein
MPQSALRGRLWDRIVDGISLALLAGIALIAALTFRDYGLGWDDYTHSQYGELLLQLFSSGFTDRRALSFVNLYEYGGGFDMAAALLAKILPFDLFETRRLAGAVVGLAGLAVTWRIGRRVGGPLAGLIGLALLAACPLYYGHMFMNPKDAPFAVAMAVLVLALVRAFQEYPAPSPATAALTGVGIGLAIGTRILGVFAGLYGLAALLFALAVETRALGGRRAGERVGTFVLALLPVLVLAYAVLALVWPWAIVELLNPIKALLYFSHFFEKPWRELFAGNLILVPEMPRYYVPQLLALKLPEIMLALGICGIAGAIVAVTRRTMTVQRRATFLILALAAALPVAVTVATRPAMYNGIRHFVFVLPPLAALGGLAGAWLVERVTRWTPAAGIVMAGVIAGGFLPPVVEMARLHPYEYTHFNLIAGGVQGAEHRYMLDYWGLSLKQASQALRASVGRDPEQQSGRRWRVAVCGPHPPARIELGPRFEISWDPRGADFAMMLGEFYCRALDAPIIAEIVRDGVVYARVYDIRGRSIPTLLTLPAP